MSKHLKRLNASKVLQLHRKEREWAIKSSPGPHPLRHSIPLAMILRDYLHICDNLREAKNIITNGEILVDGVKRKNYKFPCGFMDVISIPKMKKDYRVIFNQRGKLTLLPIQSDDAKWKLCRIENKTVLRGKKTQLNLHDGRNKLVEKNEFIIGDVIKIVLENQKIEDVYKFENGAISLIIGGAHIGETANIENLEIITSPKANLAKMKGKTEFSTIQDYVFPIGKTKPVIPIPEVKMQ